MNLIKFFLAENSKQYYARFRKYFEYFMCAEYEKVEDGKFGTYPFSVFTMAKSKLSIPSDSLFSLSFLGIIICSVDLILSCTKNI